MRLQALAYWRAPYLAGRLALSALKAAGVVYAVLSAAILGVVLPDLLGVVTPGIDALALVERWMLPALGALAGGRLLFQDVPTRGARAFLLLPVSRRRVAGGVLMRSLSSPFNLAPLAFAIPFAIRVVEPVAGAGAWAWAGIVVAVVALSHAALVLWKTQLGERPVAVVAGLALAAGAVALGEWASEGLLAATRAGAWGLLPGLGALAAAGLLAAFRGLESALSLDRSAATRRAARGSGGFQTPGLRSFMDLDWRLITRNPYPRGTTVNAVVLSVGLAGVAAWVSDDTPTTLLLVFSAGALAGSVGQFAVPFTSGHFDRLVTLPGALDTFVRAKYAGIAGATIALGLVQTVVVLMLRPEAAWLIGVSMLFSLGVLAPAALWGSTLGPKPIDLSGRVAFNYKVQSFGGQVMVGGTAVVAGGLVALAGPSGGPLAAAALGLAGVLSAPVWLRALAARIHARRHPVGTRFRATL